MSNSIRSDSSVVLPLALVLALVGWGTLSSVTKLETMRPSASSGPPSPPGSDQRLEARLWQDPLEASSAAVDRGGLTSAARQPDPPRGRAMLLPVVTQSGRHAEASERRLRDRYAVVTALFRAGYVPADSEQLGVMSVPTGGDVGANLTTSDPAPAAQAEGTAIPFERFMRDPAGSRPSGQIRPPIYDEILVVWLAGDSVGSSDLAQVLAKIVGYLSWDGSVAAIGPWSSDGLIRLLMRPELPDTPDQFDFFVSSATISPVDLERAGVTTVQRPWLTRLTATDDRLVDALIRELRFRRILPPPTSAPTRAVVLVSEADTWYGRSLPQAFQRSLASQVREDLRPSYLGSLQHYTYLRGVDGIGTGPIPSSPIAATGEAKNSTKSADPLAPSEDIPRGPSQYDYVRRLVDRVEADLATQRLRVGAVGIFATDVYDKLLILQAMRSRFPGVVFFTTDLDARLLMPSQYAWTHNLVVASGYDLQLGERIQGAIAPFRDTYQTSMFLSVLVAAGAVDPPEEQQLPVRVFEIGRTRAHDLTANYAACSPHLVPDRPPELPLRLRARRTIPAALTIVLLVFMLVYGRTNARISEPAGSEVAGSQAGSNGEAPSPLSPLARAIGWARMGDWRRTLLTTAMVLIMLFGIIVLLGIALRAEPVRCGGEPFAFFEGISTWPTEGLRMLALMLVLYYVVMLLVQWEEDTSRIAERYEFHGAQAPATRLSVMNWAPHRATLDALELWRAYAGRATIGGRLVRTAVATGVYMGFGMLLFASFEMPPKPIRGSLAGRLDFVLIYVLAIASSFLILLIWDAARLSNRVIHALAASTETIYPRASVADGLDRQTRSSMLDISLIADLTATLGQAYRYPAIVLFLMIVSRASLFDHWPFAIPILAIFFVGFGIILATAWVVREAAGRARTKEIQRLRAWIAVLRGQRAGVCDPSANENISPSDGPAEIDRKLGASIAAVEAAIARIEAMSTGAFSSLRDDPVLKSLLIPLGGGATVLFMQWMARYLSA